MEFSKNKTLIPVRIPAEPDPDFLYLGIWAIPEKEIPDTANFNILPYHYTDRSLLRADYDLCLCIYQKWVSRLGTVLNRLHGVSYSTRSWKILLGPWLLGFVNVLCDRYRSLDAALKETRIGKVITLSEDSFYIPLDYLEYVYLLEEDKYNHQIYSQLLSLFKVSEDMFETLSRKENQLDPSAITNRKEVFKNTLKRRLNKLIQLIPGSEYSQIAIRLLGFGNTLALFYKSRGRLRPLIAPFLFPSEIDSDRDQRRHLGQELVLDDTKNDPHFLDKALERLIPDHLPRLYLEGFKSLRNIQTQKSKTLILGGGEVHQDEACKAWVAESISRNPEKKIIVGQHGGFYGTAAFSPLEFHERDIADFYLTMGWQEERTIPYSNPLLFSTVKRPGQSPLQGCVLFASNTGPRYMRRIWSSPVARSLLEYFHSREEFLRAVGEEYGVQILVRLHPRDHGWGQKALLGTLPWVRFDEGGKSFKQRLSEAQLCVVDNNHTTVLESLAEAKPTILYLDPAYWELREVAKPYFEDLRKQGVFHESAASAGKFLHELLKESKIEQWWTSQSVQQAVSNFQDRFCYREENWSENLLCQLE